MDTLVKFIVDAVVFERMARFNPEKDWEDKTYAEFILWNAKCFEELEEDCQQDILRICKSIGRQFIRLVDEEHCCEFTACSVYFNKNKQLCIVNPR
jgi:hypothetical protein